MNALDELSEVLTGRARAIILAERQVDLTSLVTPNILFVLKMSEGSLAAGGRGGGFGERNVSSVAVYRLAGGKCEKLLETSDPRRVEDFAVPFYVSRIPIIMRDGTELMGYGVIEPELVHEYAAKAGLPRLNNE